MKPGIYEDVSHEQYHQGEFADHISSSMIRRFLSAPVLYHRAVDVTPEMQFGTAYHELILEGIEIPKLYKTAAAQEKCEARAAGMQAAIMSSPKARGLIQNTRHEVTVLWDEGDMPCKVRLDMWNEELYFCADLKTAASASPSGFESATRTQRYDIQAAWYMRGVAHVLERDDLPAFLFLAQEKKPPYLIGFYDYGPDRVYNAMAAIDEALVGIKECQQSGIWPGYADEVVTIY